MFYEKLDFKVDIEKLREEVKRSVFTLGGECIQGKEYETPQYNGFGGYSLQSRTGDWRDGFAFFQNEEGTTLEEVFFPKGANNYETLKYLDIAHSLEYKNPTQGCVGEIKKVLDQLDELGFYTRRARITNLKAGSKSVVHSDGPEQEYMARIHIPLWTNPKCVFICEGENLHMPADGSAYILWVNKWHQIRNDGDTDRYNLLIDAYDTKHVTKNFHYEGDITQLQNYADELRKRIDATVITPEQAAKFEAELDNYRNKK